MWKYENNRTGNPCNVVERYKTGDGMPARHQCERKKGHEGPHVCWGHVEPLVFGERIQGDRP